jgi:NAD(P)-dependent dehydrogenase (short-subunit alcohol dehydrogenase family)
LFLFVVCAFRQGIGKAICQLLLTDHPDTVVILASRDAKRGADAIADIVRNAAATGDSNNCKERLQLLQMDTSSDESVKGAAATLEDGTELYGIINNAGVRAFLCFFVPFVRLFVLVHRRLFCSLNSLSLLLDAA